MSIPFSFNIIAQLDDNTTATNFDSGCYAVDINYTLANTLATSAITGTPLYFDINNSAPDGNLESGKFEILEGNFTNGTVSPTIGLNVQRFADNPRNPFVINSGDIGINVDDNGSYGISGVGFSTDPNDNATLYFGRVHVPDIQTPEESIDVRFNYELYCDDYNSSIFTLPKGEESPDSVHWYNNGSHTEAYGRYDLASTSPQNGTSLDKGASTFTDINTSLGGLNAPHKDRIIFRANSWLLFDKTEPSPVDDSFNIHFTSATNSWAGKGKMGKSVDNNMSKRSSKKMEW
jgi:hypothetical protein